MKPALKLFIFLLALTYLLSPHGRAHELGSSTGKAQPASDHFDGRLYFNPGAPQPSLSPGQAQTRSRAGWIWRWIFGSEWPEWPKVKEFTPGTPPITRVPKGKLSITPVGHATFLIQIDGLNILTDPIWSERCSPVSWVGPKRYTEAGIRFEDLPPIDVVLVSHNHYDHLDQPTLKRLAEKGASRAIVPIGNLDLIQETGIPHTDELDWWQSVRLSPDVTVTLVPAQHFSSRTLWDRNETLWGGFVVSGPSGNVYHAGDTGYGPHFREIARRFPAIRVALLPIAPFRPRQAKDTLSINFSVVHTGPAEAIQAHLDLGAQLSIAAHFQVFQLGADGFGDAVNELASTLRERNLNPGAFIIPTLGQAIEPTTPFKEAHGLVSVSKRLQIVSGIGEVKTFIDQWKIGHDITDSRVTQGSPVEE
jgi:L-ascorbate metabolism protein UlaG (beta-lactamase superfamily)